MNDVDMVAKAMWLTHTGDFPAWSELTDDDRHLYRSLAQAAINALGLTPEWAVQNNGPENPPYHSHKTIAGAESHRQTILGNYPGALRRKRRELDAPVVVSRLVSSWTEALP